MSVIGIEIGVKIIVPFTIAFCFPMNDELTEPIPGGDSDPEFRLRFLLE